MGKKSREKRDRPQRLHIPPPKYMAIIDAVSERDREFFEAHPDENYCLRPYVPGEFPLEAYTASGETPPAQDAWTMVEQIKPGWRVRQVVFHGPAFPPGPLVLFATWKNGPIDVWVEPWPEHEGAAS